MFQYSSSLKKNWLFLQTYPHWAPADVEPVLAYAAPDGSVEVLAAADFAVRYAPCLDRVLLNTA